ncbi:MAG: hypothetical protein ACK5V0_00670 [Alphaproteobacteria bacterium]|jgi:hypothetical protein|nr:hypothetical protein [Rhodocyclaceae bacterium]MCA4902113.1 hypothetical protein [Rhodocyclaceae bacterium]
MNLATLRVDGTDQAIQAMCNLLGLEPDQTWKKGDPRRRGGFFSSSGLSATIADAKNPGEMVVAIREFVAQCKARDFAFSGSNLSAELAIGVTVGDTEQFVAFVDFSASDLLALGALGVELSIAAYPTSDEANAVT